NRLVSWAGVVERPSPASDAPMSLMTTLAPARAIAIAISRPMPPPPPVTAATLPSNIPAIRRSPCYGSIKRRSADPVNSLDGVNGAGLPAPTRGTLLPHLNSKRGNRPMPDTPTFGRYAEIPYDKMTPEQQEGYRTLNETRGRLPGPNKIYVHNPKL